ncbi:MAG: VWA domain-containing protein [Planctomycetota bacterium]|nr:MAG: VWA domain-containing protein [Planctomycetota bacterium]
MPGVPRNGSTKKVTLPPQQDSDRIYKFNNPNKYTFPSASSSLPKAYRNVIGYITYVQFMMDWGRDRSPDASNSVNADPGVGTKTPLSKLSPFVPYHSEMTAGGTFSFPPRSQPMHAVRRALIAAINVVKEQNKGLSPNVSDWVGVVTFDALDAYHQPEVLVPLTADFKSAMQACTTMQAVSDIGTSTATEAGIIKAREILKPISEGGQARSFTSKVMVVLSDGVPNAWQSPTSEINDYITQNPNADYYDPAYVWYNAALRQAAMFQGENGVLFPVGMGLGADYDFMDRMARFAKTAENGQSPRGSGNPAEYEQTLIDIFTEIIQSPGARLVE